MNLTKLVAKYNAADMIRHNLYKKRSARERRALKHLLNGRLEHTIPSLELGAIYSAAQRANWSTKDQRELDQAIAKVKRIGKVLTKRLKADGLVAIRPPGRNQISYVTSKKAQVAHG